MKNDIRLVVIVLTVIVGVAVAFSLLESNLSPLANTVNEDSVLVADNGMSYIGTTEQPTREIHLVPFDPNTADSTTLLGLGLSQWTVRGIYRYRAKGGFYSTPEDFGRTYGISYGQYKRLKPYIRISDDFRPAAEMLLARQSFRNQAFDKSSSAPSARRDSLPRVSKLRPGETLSLNQADTNALKRVPGIGSYYARKIVELRNRYGGFTSLSQLLEIKNFPQESLNYLIIPDGGISKINLNRATFKQLAHHPYIQYERAKVISNYRRLHGRITSLSQLSLLPGFSESERQRLEEYVEY